MPRSLLTELSKTQHCPTKHSRSREYNQSPLALSLLPRQPRAALLMGRKTKDDSLQRGGCFRSSDPWRTLAGALGVRVCQSSSPASVLPLLLPRLNTCPSRSLKTHLAVNAIHLPAFCTQDQLSDSKLLRCSKQRLFFNNGSYSPPTGLAF